MKRISSTIVATLLIVAAHPAMAQFQVNIDENGGGTYFGPNGESHTWGTFVTKSSPPVYHLLAAFAAVTPPEPNFIPTPGDVIVNEVSTAQISSDLLRFDGKGNLTVYSDLDNVPPFALTDVGVPAPGPVMVILPETSPTGGPPVEGGVNGLFGYQPAPGMPGGFPAGSVGTMDYNFFSDGSVPEPSTGVLAVLACGLMWWKRKMIRRVA
jgi:hypothetical protein